MADQLSSSHRPPFATFTEGIRLGMPAEELHAAYLRLYRRACRAVACHAGAAADTDPPSEGEALISYNMAMTKSTMVLSPRLAEGASIVSPDGRTLGMLSLNGTVLAGTALVKNELEWEALIKEPDALSNILRGIGIPHDEEGDVKLQHSP